MTVQEIDGKPYVCDIEPLATIKEFLDNTDENGVYMGGNSSASYKKLWFYRLDKCHKIPCDSNPKWKELVNCEVVEDVDYTVAISVANNYNESIAQMLHHPTTHQPEYASWDDAENMFFADPDRSGQSVAGWLKRKGYKLVKPQ